MFCHSNAWNIFLPLTWTLFKFVLFIHNQLGYRTTMISELFRNTQPDSVCLLSGADFEVKLLSFSPTFSIFRNGYSPTTTNPLRTWISTITIDDVIKRRKVETFKSDEEFVWSERRLSPEMKKEWKTKNVNFVDWSWVATSCLGMHCPHCVAFYALLQKNT